MSARICKKVVVFVFFALLACSALCFCAFCDEVSTDEQVLSDLSEIAGDIRDDTGALSDVADADMDELGDALTSAIEPRRLLKEVAAYVSAGLPDAISMLCTLMGLILLSALCRSIGEGLSGGKALAGLEFCSTAAIMSAMIVSGYGSFALVAEYFEDLSRLLESMIPVAGTVWAMGGNVGTATVGTAGLYALLAVLQRLCAVSIMPVCLVMGATAVCSALSDGSLLGGFGGAVKKIYNFFIGAIMTIIVFALGAQTTVASAADTVGARGAKLISSTVIPVVGGAVGDTLRTVAGSVQYVKGVVGIGGMLFIAYTTLPVFISVLLSRLVVLVTSSAAQMLGCQREAKLLDELGGIYGCVLGVVSISAVAFCVALAIFVKCTVAVT